MSGADWQQPLPPSDDLFDGLGLAAKVKARLARDGQSFRQAAVLVPTSPATLCRVAAGYRPDVETFLRLVRWLSQADAPTRTKAGAL